MLMAIDVGNTNMVFGLLEGKELVGSFRLMTDANRTSDEIGLTVCEYFRRFNLSTDQVCDIIIASVVGVGKVVSATDVFALVQENIINLPLPGLVKVAAITTIIAGITGSASGGLTIALELFGETFISWGYTPEIIHRVASIACGGLDTLPWNGTVVMLFALSGVSYKKGYKHVAMETVILPLLSLIPVFIYYSIVH